MSTQRDIVRIALRNLARNYRRTLMTGSMVGLGVAAIVFFRAYIGGLQQLIYEYVVENQSGAMQIEREGYSASRDLAPLNLDLKEGVGLEKTILEGLGVDQVAPRLRFGALLLNGDISTMVMGLGVDPVLEKEVCPRSPQAGYRFEGSFNDRYGVEGPGLSDRKQESILIGVALAKGLGIKLGDKLTLLAQTATNSTDAIDVTVQGIFRVNDAEVNKRSVVVPLGVAQKLLHMNGRVSAFVASAKRSKIQGAVESLRASFTSAHPKVSVLSWEQLAPYYRDVITLQNDIMAIVTALFFVILVAGVANTMLMAVFERQQEIGTLMAIGFRRTTIIALFIIEAAGLGLWAAVTGALGGVALVLATRRMGFPVQVGGVGTITHYPVLDAGYVFIAVAIATVAALVAGLYPAWRASRLRPVDALRLA